MGARKAKKRAPGRPFRCGVELLQRVEQRARLGVAERRLEAAVVAAEVGRESSTGRIGRRGAADAEGGADEIFWLTR